MRNYLSKNEIANYARINFNKRTPESGNRVVPYYDFSVITGNYDCTNFVSHALLAGGAKIYNNWDSATGWYYVDLDNRSYSWSGVQNLYEFLINNKGQGPSGTHQDYYEFNNGDFLPYDIGDILQFYNGLVWRHSTIITGFYRTRTNEIGALVTGRTSPYAYDNNKKAEYIYRGEMKRVIKLN